MFEVSFGELLTIGVVALVVLGPERLPTVARTIGALVGRAQRFVASVKADIHSQSQLAGLQELQRDMQQAADAFRNQIETEVAQVRQVASDIEHEAATIGRDVAADNAPPQAAEFAANVPAVEEAPAVHKDDNQLDLFDTPQSAPAHPAADHRS